MCTAIICDGFKIGGIERLALDQAYALNSVRKNCKIIVLSEKPDKETPSFKNNESELIEGLKVQFVYISGTRITQYKKLVDLIDTYKFDDIISHSLRGSVLIFLIRFLKNHNFKLTTTIHQLPTLSAPFQLYRRMLYSQFTDKLFIFSVAARNDWNYRRSKNIFIRFLTYKRKIAICRNGVYLPRLKLNTKSFESRIKQIDRLVFIGRLTAWKGLDTFIKIAQLESMANFKILLVTPTDPTEYLKHIDSNLLKRTQCIVGNSISQIDFFKGDLLLYPANYGKESKFVEGVSINVLEMACLGVPSLISKNGSDTWPELLELGLVQEVDWENIESVASTIKSNITIPSIEQVIECRTIISISHNLDSQFTFLHSNF